LVDSRFKYTVIGKARSPIVVSGVTH
jgi:hypothetical protein